MPYQINPPKRWPERDKVRALQHPVHDRASHGSDTFRTGAVTSKDGMISPSNAVRVRRSGSFMSE